MKLAGKIGLASALALAIAGVAVAQDRTINDYVRDLVAGRADPGERLVGDIELSEIGESEYFDVSFTIDPAKTYFVYASCDDDCTDIDMLAVGSNGEEVDGDYEDDAEPLLMILPGEAGDELHVGVDMMACATEVCVIGIGLYEVEE